MTGADDLTPVLRGVLLAIALLGYYGVLVPRYGRLSRPLVNLLRLGRRHPARDVRAALNLPVAGLAQLLFALLLAALAGVPLVPLFTQHLRPALAVQGALLGVGEMALATLFGSLALSVVMSFGRGRGPGGRDEWQAVLRGGWMRYFVKTLEVVPAPAAVASILLYVGVEEIIFRGIAITVLLPLGPAWSVALSTLLFAAVQTFSMPDWHAALLPVVGALVLGVIHGLLFLAVPNVVPLILAHFVFFRAAVS